MQAPTINTPVERNTRRMTDHLLVKEEEQEEDLHLFVLYIMYFRSFVHFAVWKKEEPSN